MVPVGLLILLAATPAALDAPTVFLPVPDGDVGAPVQEHPSGRLHRTSKLSWYPMWTGGDAARAEVLAVTPPVRLAGGAWRALVEQWHLLPVGAPLATVRARVDGAVVAEVTTRARAFPGVGVGGLQADAVMFEVPDGGSEVTVEVSEARARGLWVGAVQLAVRQPRPLFAIQHCANAPQRAEVALANGANAVEIDVVWRDGAIAFAHPVGAPPACWGLATSARDVPDYLRRLAQVWQAGELALVLLDVKAPGVDTARYLGRLVDLIDAAALPHEAVVVSVSDCDAGAVRAALAAAGFRGGLDVWQDAAVEGCAGRPAGEDWLAGVVEAFDPAMVGLGADPAYLARLMPGWLDDLRAHVHRRDVEGRPAKVYYWTVDRQVSMRVALDMGVDGLIVNRVRYLDAVLGERPYRGLFRLATPDDDALGVVHGAPATGDGTR